MRFMYTLLYLENELMNTLRTTIVMTKSSSFKFACFIGIITLITSVGAKVNALESAELLTAQRLAQPPLTETIPEKESNTTDTSNYQLTNSTSHLSDKNQQSGSKPQKDVSVNVDDIPLECRSYFPSKGSVSLFNYRQGMEQCRYGDD